MANSKNTEEGSVSPEESTTDLEEYQEMSETKYGLSDLDTSPGFMLPLHESMDVDSNIPKHVTESWADSMEHITEDTPDFQSHTYTQDNTVTERQDNAYEDHMSRQYTQGSRDSWRPRGHQAYHGRWSQSRASNWRGLRGRGRGSWEPRDRRFRGRASRNRDFRSGEPRNREYRRGRRTYRYSQHFIPRGRSTCDAQTRFLDYGLNSPRRRDQRNLEEDEREINVSGRT